MLKRGLLLISDTVLMYTTKYSSVAFLLSPLASALCLLILFVWLASL